MTTEELKQALNLLREEDPEYFSDLVKEIVKENLTAYLSNFGHDVSLEWNYNTFTKD